MDGSAEFRTDPAEFVAEVTSAANLAATLEESRLISIGQDAVQDYRDDLESMKDWLDRMDTAIGLAGLVRETKTYPFEKCANVKYPLVTTAALQFNARAYPAIVPSGDIVASRIRGNDRTGEKAARGDRVASYMSWQLSDEVEEWDEDTDRLLMQLPIVGDMFRKVWFDGERVRTRLIEPGKFIVNDNCSTLEAAPRCTEEFALYPYEIAEREADGRFVSIVYTTDADKQGPQDFIEHHCRIDLDDDGYPEPYIATVHVETASVVRLVADFAPEDVKYSTEQAPALVQGPFGPEMAMTEVNTGIAAIKRSQYFVHYQFMPGVEGKFWGIGLGFLLGDISESVNATFNLLLDSGHMASLGGGFIGADMRIKGGAQRMRPGEWRQVSSFGQDIRQAMVPITYPTPDATLFQLLGMLIDAGKEVASVKDIMTGESATNMQPTTVMALIEQGMKVFTASYKRIYRSLKKEFRQIARINARTLTPEAYNQFLDDEQMYDPAADFAEADRDVQPVADPNAITRMQEMAKAELLMQLAEKGMVDPVEAASRVMEAAAIENREALAPKPDPMQVQMAQAMAQLQMDMAMADLGMKRAEIGLTLAKIEGEQAGAAKDIAGIEVERSRVQLDALKAMLAEIGADIDRTIAGRSAGMARAPGNGSAA